MLREGWMSDDFDLTDLKDYDFNTFTSGSRSVVQFKDMDSDLLNRLRTLFSTYVFWPTKLFPLIDHVKNNHGPFVESLFNNLRRITYYEKFGEWPEPGAAGASNDGEESIRGPINGPSTRTEGGWTLDDPESEKFAGLLVREWHGPGKDTVINLIEDIAAGRLKPEVEIPSTPQALGEWLEMELDEAALKRTRDELRSIAKVNSAVFTTGLQIPAISSPND